MIAVAATYQRYKRPLGFGAGLSVVALVVLAITTPLMFYAELGIRLVRSRLGLMHVDLNGAEQRLRTTLGAHAILPFREPRIVISKSARSLDLLDGERLIKRYVVGLGDEPTHTKTRKGDERTPEGRYFLCTRRLGTKDYLFMGLNYPNASDAQAALQRGDIDVELHRQIVSAEQQRQTPPWRSQMGGAIGIHGGGTHDWTNGCISLQDKDAAEVFVATSDWTPVRINP